MKDEDHKASARFVHDLDEDDERTDDPDEDDEDAYSRRDMELALDDDDRYLSRDW